MAIIRWVLGRIILLLNFIFTPRSMKRTEQAQREVDKGVAELALYQFEACPFCVKVRRAAKRYALNLETRDAKKNEQHRQQLEQGGGRVKVPCLRIEKDDGQVEWMYESKDIISYLENRFVS